MAAEILAGRAGERARSRTPDTELDLTGHYHLSKVFRKLGITGRGQLAHRLPGR